MSITATDFIAENAGGSDSDSNSEESPEYYQPISAADDVEDSDSDQDPLNSDEDQGNQSSNGYIRPVENGVSSLHINDDVGGESTDEEQEDEESLRRGASDSAISRAFREDVSRRNAPLTPENTMRVMEAMRRVSFAGVAPEWVNQLPEDQWIDQLRRLRESSNSTST